MSSGFVFTVDRQNYGLPLEVVEEAVAMPWIDRVAESPRDVCGVLDLRGTVVTVVDPAYRLGAPVRPPRAADFLLIVRTRAGRVALRVDALVGLQSGAVTAVPPPAEGPAFITGLMQADGLVTLLAIDDFLQPSVRAFLEAQTAAQAKSPA